MSRGRWRGAAGLLAAALIGIGVALTVNTLGLRARRVVSLSMFPTIHKGDWIVTSKTNDGGRGLKRREIVLFRFPLGTSGRAVKRIVAVAGDRIAISPDLVVVNGRATKVAGAPSAHAGDRRTEIVPAGDVFLLGDNAAVSIDSRSFGPVPESQIVGRVLFVVHKRTLLVALGVAAALTVFVLALLWRARRE